MEKNDEKRKSQLLVSDEYVPMKHAFHKHGAVLILLIMMVHAATASTEKILPATTANVSASGAWSPELGRPFIRNYTPKEYGAAPSNWAIVQDKRGIIYFGNAEGLLEYDGASWRRIATPNRTVVRSLAIDQNDRIYVGEVGTFGYLAPDSLGTLRYVSLLELVPEEDRKFADVWSSRVTKDGIYFTTYNTLFRLAPEAVPLQQKPPLGNFLSEAKKPSLVRAWKAETRFQFAFVVNDRLYVDQRDVGLMCMEGDSLRLVPGGGYFASRRISAMLPFDDRQILIGTMGHGLFLYDGAAFRPFATEADSLLKQNHLYQGIVLANGTFALATIRGGVIIMDSIGRVLQRLDKTTGLQDNFVLAMRADLQGGLWLALFNGISRVETPSPLSLFGEESRLKGAVVAVIRHRDLLYVATGLGVYCLETAKSAEATFKPVAGIATQCWAFLPHGDDLLVASNEGVYRISRYGTTNLGLNGAISLFRSQNDSSRIFVGQVFGLGLLLRSRNQWVNAGNIFGIEEEIRSIAEDSAGRLWLGTKSQGILRVTLSAFGEKLAASYIERFSRSDGLPEGEINVNGVNRRILFAGVKGLYRFDETSRHFLPDSSLDLEFTNGTTGVGVLASDDHGNVWLSATQEVGDELNLFMRQPDESYQRIRTPFLRIPKTAIWAIYPENDSIKDGMNGPLWFGGAEGLMQYDPKVRKDYAIPFSALIRRVIVDIDSIIFGGTSEVTNSAHSVPALSPQTKNLRFEFSATSFEAESENRFQTYLEGFEKNWSPWTRETKRDYTNLSEGEYRFHVRAQNVYEQPSLEGVFAFTILPPWYQTWWAYGFYGLALVVGVFTVDRMQRRRLIKKERLKAAAELIAAENARKARELDEARQLQLSMLPTELPQLPHIDIGVYMKTATEVGGDYYDFHLAENGALTVIIGDASGHGLNAGMMVTATKSALESLIGETDLSKLFAQINSVLRRMRLRKLYMVLNVIRIQNNRASICGVGMPPVLVYRAASCQIEEISLKGMPLGSVVSYPYQIEEMELCAGDVIVMMTDGFPEQLNERGEMMEYGRAKELLATTAPNTPNEIIRWFVEASEAWGADQPQHDDMTFIVMKVRDDRQGLSNSI